MSRAITMTGELAHKIATGGKTLHLHPARHDRDMRYRRCPFPPGVAIPVVRENKPDEDPDLYVEVTASRQITLAQVTLDDVRALGYRRLYDHQHAWLARHDPAADLADPVAAIQRYTWRWHARPVWRLEIRPAEAPRLLSARPPSQRSGEGDYTTDPRRAMLDAGEAIPAAEQDKFSLAGRLRDYERELAEGNHKGVARAARNLSRYKAA